MILSDFLNFFFTIFIAALAWLFVIECIFKTRDEEWTLDYLFRWFMIVVATSFFSALFFYTLSVVFFGQWQRNIERPLTHSYPEMEHRYE